MAKDPESFLYSASQCLAIAVLFTPLEPLGLVTVKPQPFALGATIDHDAAVAHLLHAVLALGTLKPV